MATMSTSADGACEADLTACLLVIATHCDGYVSKSPANDVLRRRCMMIEVWAKMLKRGPT